jgi:hypothetical protein
MDSETILFDKEGFKFIRIKKNHYKLEFSMENKYIVLSKIIDFSLIKLIYDLNNDVYEKVNVEKINDYEAIVTLLMKHLFEDLGLPQKFSHVHMKKIIDDKKITFNSQPIKTHRPEGMPKDAELMSVQNANIKCEIITPHNINFSIDILFDTIHFPPFAEKMVGMILHKIFKRVKQFIENVRI